MTFYLASVAILLLAALTMGVWAIAFTLTPPKRRQNRRSNLCGSTAAALACLIGFAGMAAGPWDFASLPHMVDYFYNLSPGESEAGESEIQSHFGYISGSTPA